MNKQSPRGNSIVMSPDMIILAKHFSEPTDSLSTSIKRDITLHTSRKIINARRDGTASPDRTFPQNDKPAAESSLELSSIFRRGAWLDKKMPDEAAMSVAGSGVKVPAMLSFAERTGGLDYFALAR